MKDDPRPRGVRGRLRLQLAELSSAVPGFRGKTRLVRAIDAALARPTDRLVVQRNGVTFATTGSDLIEVGVLYERGYAGGIVRALVAHAPAEGGVYWDIGANIGTTSLTVAARKPSLLCVAFEPSPPVLARLSDNVARNPSLAERVRLVGVALSDRTGLVPFYASKYEGNAGLGGLGAAANRQSTPAMLWAMRGDDLVAQGELPAPQLLKLDVEGHEIEVLRGLEATLRSASDVTLVFEHCLYRLAERGRPRGEVCEFLSALGFRLFRLQKNGDEVELSAAHLQTDCDILAKKSSR